MSEAVTIAALLAQKLGHPNNHSVYVRNGPDMDVHGELIQRIIVHTRPGAKVTVPTTFMGYDIHREDWPQGD